METQRQKGVVPPTNLLLWGLVLSLLLNALVGGLLFFTRSSAGDYYACMAKWQQETSIANKARADAAESADEAQRESWAGLDNVLKEIQPGHGAAFAQSLEDLRTLRAKQVQEDTRQAKIRRDNTLPDFPKEVCGDPKEIRR